MQSKIDKNGPILYCFDCFYEKVKYQGNKFFDPKSNCPLQQKIKGKGTSFFIYVDIDVQQGKLRMQLANENNY